MNNKHWSGTTPMAPHRPHDHFAAGFGPFRAASTPFSPIIIFRPIFDHLPYPLLSPSGALSSPNGYSHPPRRVFGEPKAAGFAPNDPIIVQIRAWTF